MTARDELSRFIEMFAEQWAAGEEQKALGTARQAWELIGTECWKTVHRLCGRSSDPSGDEEAGRPARKGQR